ncbi:MAG TPA: hypothetical protein VLA88_00925 [Candidatus Saccharimonadales bacterium]|nr:hypothetical protein [Candidatus Saccharimonadales bacterium]
MRDFVTETLERRPAVGASHLVTLISRALQAQAYGRIAGYPEAFQTASDWSRLFATILEDPDMSGHFLTDVYTRDPQSLVINRYVHPKGFITLARELGRISTIRVLDVGCSLNGGANYLASDIAVDWPGDPEEYRIGLPAPQLVYPGSRSLFISEKLSRAYRHVVNAPFPLEYALGIDKTAPKDAWEWAFANSFNPGELLDKKRVHLFNRIVRDEYENVGFLRADFATLNEEEFAEQYPGDWPVVNLSTMLYQSDEATRATMLEKAKRIATEFVVVSDFMRVNQGNLEFLDDWNEGTFPYIMAVWDKREEYPLWHEIFLNTDGRAAISTFGKGRIITATDRPESLWTPFGEFRVRSQGEM